MPLDNLLKALLRYGRGFLLPHPPAEEKRPRAYAAPRGIASATAISSAAEPAYPSTSEELHQPCVDCKGEGWANGAWCHCMAGVKSAAEQRIGHIKHIWNEEQKPRPTRYCRRCRLELIHTGHGRLRAATREQADGAPSFTLIGPRVLVTHCPKCHYSSVWAGREAPT